MSALAAFLSGRDLPLTMDEGKMSQETVGQAAKHVVTFLRELHADVAAMVRSLDGLFDKRGWVPPPKYQNRIANLLSNGLANSDRWVLSSLYRMYVPRTEVESIRRVVLFQVDFAPAAFDHAIVVVGMAKYDAPTTADAIWSGWESSIAIETHLASAGGSTALLPRETWCDDVAPRAVEMSGFVQPLDSLTDDTVLASSVVAPALHAFG